MSAVSSPKRTIEFSPGQPTVLIGERINPTGRQKLAESLARGNFGVLLSEAQRQVEAGADILDVNVTIPSGDEPALLREAVLQLVEKVGIPLCLDSANPAALEAALAVYPGRALVNSVTGEAHSLEAVLPLVKRHRAVVVGLPLDEHGIPGDPGLRLVIARRILEAAVQQGLSTEDVIIDCLATAAAVDPRAGAIALETVRLVSQELRANTLLGVSNVSFGLPGRAAINACFLGQAIAAGLTCAIADPTDPSVVQTIAAADLLAGRDEYARRYLAHYRRTRPR